MLKLVDLDDYQLIPIAKRWFCGKIYVDKRAKIFPWQMTILEKFITEIITQSPKATKTKLDFHILVTGDSHDNEYTVDVFAFIDGMAMDNQTVFNNAFSGIHWGLNAILTTISQICAGLISHIPSNNIDNQFEMDQDDHFEDNGFESTETIN